MLVPDIERYGKLQQFLAEGNFREADAETLRVILETAGRTRDTLTPEDMMRFPVNVIRVLDRLWKNYSGDHFGYILPPEVILTPCVPKTRKRLENLGNWWDGATKMNGASMIMITGILV